MASITKEQVEKLNNSCKNGFHFDLRGFIFHNEKEFSKDIQIEENVFICAKLMYYSKWDRTEGKNINTPTLHLSKWYNEGTLSRSTGLGYFVTVGEAVKRKNTGVLFELMDKFDDETCLKLYDEQCATKVNIFA